MTKDEAIHILEHERDNDIFCSSYRQKVHVAMTMGIEALQTPPITQRRMYQLGYRQGKEEALKDRLKSGWIPCTESMPDDGKWAIWCSSDGAIGIARFKKDCYDHFYPNETSFNLEDAVAWMPLEPFYDVDMRGEDK